jgi:hypothetical protein
MSQSLCFTLFCSIIVTACGINQSVPSTLAKHPDLNPAFQTPVETYKVSGDILDTSLITNPNHPESNYISVGLPFSPAKSLKQEIERKTGRKLIDRGEAHITVVTPPEMDVLRQKLSKERIAELTGVDEIQDENFSIVCLGRGRITSSAKTLETYFIVVASRGLVERRTRLEQDFLAMGGAKTEFRAAYYFPHVTLGYTDRDLHESDGIIKDEKSCVAPLEISY